MNNPIDDNTVTIWWWRIGEVAMAATVRMDTPGRLHLGEVVSGAVPDDVRDVIESGAGVDVAPRNIFHWSSNRSPHAIRIRLGAGVDDPGLVPLHGASGLRG